MFDLSSLLIGSAISIITTVASTKYQSWKGGVFARVRIFLQSNRQININSVILNQSNSDPELAKLLLNKVNFLPPYPYADFYPIDDSFQSICMTYERSLSLLLSGKIDIQTFNVQSNSSMKDIQGLLTLWNDFLRKYLLLYFLLPILFRKIAKKYFSGEKSQWYNQRKHIQ